ncbi:hypothetical protein PV04_03438 [Phialophora macrospora]|uniref:RNase MRP protein 1 RNA binding domain-containing protein n=1 Tax=Phialophora macrospora TaxID=1851006 RepID=A0A0D2FS96_9EURO|nr:hypothetical protein PV04_03438 [Phialophora macrospora]
MPGSGRNSGNGPHPLIDPSPAAAAETKSRSAKRRKLSHESPPNGFRTHLPWQRNTQTAVVRKKYVRHQPPRRTRPPEEKRQGPGRVKAGDNTKANIRPSVRPSTAEPDGNITTLSFAKTLLDKIWVRNKNQHRTQPWWRTISSLRKATSRLETLEDEERRLKSATQVPGSLSSGQYVRQRFERESQLRTEKEAWAEWIREVLLPKAYLGFSGLVRDAQFANLGVVLMGVLADIVSVTGAPKPSEESEDGLGRTKTAGGRQGQEVDATGEARRLEATSLRVTGLQSGELIERQYDSDDMGEIVERNTSDEGAKRMQIIDSNEGEEAANTQIDGGASRTASSTTSVSKKQKQKRPDTPKIRSATASAQLATGRMTVSGEAVAQGKSESATKSAEKASKPKQGKPRTKRKNAIDDLFAGLT